MALVLCFIIVEPKEKLIVGTLVQLSQLNDNAGTDIEFAIFVLFIG